MKNLSASVVEPLKSAILRPKETSKIKAVIYNNKPTEGSKFTRAIVLNKSGILSSHLLQIEKVKSQDDVLDILEEENKKLKRSTKVAELIFETQAWEDFSQELNQEVIFNLKKLPNKLTNYNRCLSGLENFEETVQKRFARNRSKALSCFPILQSAMDYEGSHLLSAFNKGSSSNPTEKLRKYLKMPHLTTGFAKRIARAPSINAARDLYNITFDGLIDRNGHLKEKTLQNRISRIPLYLNSWEKKEKEAFWGNLRVLNNSDLSNSAKSRVFFNINGKWIKNLDKKYGDFDNALQQYSHIIASNLILPAYIKRFQDESRNRFWKTPEKFLKFDDWFTTHILLKISDLVKDKIVSKMTPEMLINLHKEIDRRAPKISQSKPFYQERLARFKENGYESLPQWYKIFPDQEINGYKFKALTSNAELAQEASELGNCVGGMDYHCHMGYRHIISCSSPSGSRFTIRFDQRGEKVVFNEAGGVNEYQFLLKEDKNAVSDLCRRINEGEIQISNIVGNIDKSLAIGQVLGFNPENESHLNQVFEAYNEAGIIPNMGDNIEEFYQKIGLEEFFEKEIKEDIKESRQNTPSQRVQDFESSKIKDGPRELSILD